MKKSIHVNPIAVIISNPICATHGEEALRAAHRARRAAKHAVKNGVAVTSATVDTAVAHALRVAEARAAAKNAIAKARKAAAHAEKIGVEAASVKAIGKAIAVKYGKTVAQFRAAFLRIVEEHVVKHGHKPVLRVYGADIREGSSAARRAEKFVKAAKFAVDYSVTALIDKGWDAINAVSTVVNHNLTALRDALKERGKVNCFAPAKQEPIFEMKLQIFGLPKSSNPADKAVGNKAGCNAGKKEVSVMKKTEENEAFMNADKVRREIAKYNAAGAFCASIDLNNVALDEKATVEQILASVGFNARQVRNAETWLYMPDIADAVRAIGTNDTEGIERFRSICLRIDGVGAKTADTAIAKLHKYYIGAAGHTLAERPRRSTVAVETFDAYKEVKVRDESTGEWKETTEIGYKSYGLSTRNQAIDHFGEELIEKMVKACTAIPQTDAEIIRDVENAIKAFCDEADIASHSGSQNRKCGYWAIKKEFFYDFFPKLCAFGFPGLRFGKMVAAVNKTLTRLGLLFSTAKPVFDVFGIEPNIRRMAVVKDEYFIYDNIRDVVETDGTVEVAKQHAEERNKYDGAIWHRVKGLQWHPFIVRLLAIVKGLAVYAPDRFEELKQRREKDVWGNPIDWDTVDWIVPESAFKVGLPKKNAEYDGTWYRSFDEFIDAAEAVGARMYCASNFKLKRGKAPYQFVQCMAYATLDEQASYIKHCVDYMNEFMQIDTAWKLFGGLTGKVAKYYHPIMNHPFWRGIGAQAWEKKRTEILGMACPNAGAWIPITYDWTGKLRGNEFAFICDGKSPVHFEQGKLYCGGKSPMPSPAAMMELRFNNEALAGLDVAHNVVIIAADSDYWAATNSDADGDTGFFCDIEWMNNAIHRTMKTIYGENEDHTIKFCPVLFPEGDAKKVKMTYSALKEYQKDHTKTAEIGPSVNSAAWHIANENFDRKTMAIELFLSNDGINAGKHGSQGTIKLQKRGQKDNPGFRMYTKNKLEKDKVTRTKGFCDGTCLKLYKAIPKTWEPDWLNGLVWNWEDLSPIAKEDQRSVPGLIYLGDDKFGHGFIDTLAFGDVEKRSTIENDDKETEIDWLQDATASNRFAVAEYAHSVGFTFEKAYVYWMRRCMDFSRLPYTKRIETILRWGISECFGEEIVACAMEYAKRPVEEEIESFEEEIEEEEFDF